MKTVALFVISFLVVFSGASEAVMVFETDYDASQNIVQDFMTGFVVASPGKYVLTLTNPDLSRDPYVEINAYTGETSAFDNMRMSVDRIYPGYAEPIFAPVTAQGAGQRVIEFSAVASQEPLNFQFASHIDSGMDNSGINHVKLEFIPDPITTVQADYLLTIISGPTEQNSEQTDFDAGLYGGKIIIHNTQTAMWGGGHAVYLDGLGLGAADQGLSWIPEYYTYEVGPGLHHLELIHEDTYWPDNTNAIQTMVYFQSVPEPGTVALIAPALMGFAGIAVRRMRKA